MAEAQRSGATTSTGFTANKVLVTDSNGYVVASNTSSDAMAYLANVTGDVQTQLNAKQDLITNTSFSVASTDWVANEDTDTNTDYPYIAEISSALYSNTSMPIWTMTGADTIPTSTESEEIAKVSAAYFTSSGITLYATEQPSVALTLVVKGVD